MNVLVTGGLGYVGAHVVERFAARGDTLSLLDRGGPADDQREWASQFELMVGDISQAASLPGICDGVDLVVHAAALNQPTCAKNPPWAMRVNALGTRNLLEDAADAGGRLRFVYLSTIHVLGPLVGRLDETTPAHPITDYGVSKLAGEGYCHLFAHAGSVDAVVLRPANGFGAPLFASANAWMLAVNDFCHTAYTDGEIVLQTTGAQQRVFVSIDDVVSAIEILADATDLPAEDGAHVYDVGSGISVSIRELAALAAEICSEVYGRPVTVRMPEGAQNALEDPPVDFRFDRLAALGYAPATDLASGIREVAEFVARM